MTVWESTPDKEGRDYWRTPGFCGLMLMTAAAGPDDFPHIPAIAWPEGPW